MKKHTINSISLTMILLLFTVKFCYCQAPINYGNNTNAGKYFSNNGVKIYYEIYGEGTPLILLHGNGGSIKSRAPFIDEFSKKYKVIALDSRCHGKSDCPAQYLTYEQMSEECTSC